MTRRPLLALGFCLLAAALQSAEAPLIPRRLLFADDQRHNPLLSPDGQKLAFQAPHQGRVNLWIRDLATGKDRALTSFKDHSVRFFGWFYDSQTLYFYRDKGGNEEFKFFTISASGGEPKRLIPNNDVGAPPLFLHPSDLQKALLGVHGFIFSLDTSTGKLRPVEKFPYQYFWVDQQFKPRLATNWASVLYVRGPSGAWSDLMKVGKLDDFGGIVGISADDRTAFMAAGLAEKAQQLYSLDLSSGKTTLLAGDGIYDVSETLTDPLGQKVLGVAIEGSRKRWSFLDAAAAADFAILAKVRPGDISIVSQDLSGMLWAVYFNADSTPPAYYLYDRRTKWAAKLFGGHPGLEGKALAEMRGITFTASDGMKLEGYLSLPPGLAPVKLPLILNVHGGPEARDHWGFNPEVQWLCNRGYAVLQVNFRGSAGYGRKYGGPRSERIKDWGGRMSEDLIDAKRWAIAAGIADPARVGIYGASYGGYAALAGMAFTPGEYKCGVDICGPSNLTTQFFGQRANEYAGGLSAADAWGINNIQAFLAARSPINSARNITGPLFIAQGENDPRVPRNESDQIVRVLKALGKPYDYVVFPDEGHGFDKWENKLSLNEKLEAFLAKQLGGRVEAADFSGGGGADDEKRYATNMGVNLAGVGMQKMEAYVAMGDRYRDGNGVAKDPALATRWYRGAADKGDPTSMARLAELSRSSPTPEGGVSPSRSWMLKAGSSGDANGQYLLALDLREGTYGSRDSVLARRYLAAAAKQGSREAARTLGQMLERGEGGEKDGQAALTLYRQAATLSKEAAMRPFLERLEKGWGLSDEDYAKLNWLKAEQAKGGDAAAMRILGMKYREGKLVSQDYGKARDYFKKAAAKGDPDADFYLGLMAENGEQNLRSPAEGMRFYAKHLGAEGSFQWQGQPAVIGRAKGPVALEQGAAVFQHLAAIPLSASRPGSAPSLQGGQAQPQSASLRLMRDEKFLYVFAQVTQAGPVANRAWAGDGLRYGDCVELFISSKASFATRTRPAPSPFDYHLVLAPSSASKAPAWESQPDMEGLRVLAQPNAAGYTLSAAIPLAGLQGLDWTSGSQIRFEAAVTKAGKRVFWNANTDAAAEQPDRWGLARLE